VTSGGPQHDVTSANELAAAFQDAAAAGAGVRLQGRGSWAGHRAAAPEGCHVVSTRQMDRITRLDPADLTCSVEPGVSREALDAALAEHRLRLPCFGGSTLGGLFAFDPIGALAPGAAEPRSLLLGMVGMLSDGTAFKCGAKVVKSVAGFDVHKLFVGSEGLLFAATELHLKLRAAPRATAGFDTEPLPLADIWPTFLGLRTRPFPPAACAVRLEGGAARLMGSFEGPSRSVREGMGTPLLTESAPPAADAYFLPPPATGAGLLRCIVPLGQFSEWWPTIAPASVSGLVTGGGRLWATGPLKDIAALDAALFQRMRRPAVVVPAPGTAETNPRQDARLADELRRALDPEQRLR